MEPRHIEPPFVRLGWSVMFELEHNEDGWLVLEFLAWWINRDMHLAGSQALLRPTAIVPFLNGPGTCLAFEITDPDMGPNDAGPDVFAHGLDEVRDSHFETYLEANSWDEEPPSMN